MDSSRSGGWLLVGLIVLGLAGPAEAQLVNIDDFTTSQDRVRTADVNIPVAASTPAGSAGIVGDERDIAVIHTTEANPSTEVSARVDGNQFIHEGASQANSRIHLIWDGPTPPDMGPFANEILTSGLQGIDLTAGGRVDSFELVVVNADVDYDLSLNVIQNDTVSASYTDLRPTSSGARLVIPFSQLVSMGGDMNFADVGAIELIAEGVNLNLTLDFLRAGTSIRLTMVDTVLDPEGTPRPAGEPARPGDRIRYTVTVENPRDNGATEDPTDPGAPRVGFPSDPLVFTYDPVQPPNEVVTYIPESFTVVRGGVTPVVGHMPGDETVEANVDPVPDRVTDGMCPDDDSDPGCVVFSFEVLIPSDVPPGTPEVPGQGTIRTNNPMGPNPLMDFPTDDPNNDESGPPDSPGFTPDPNRTSLASCGDGNVDDFLDEQCDEGGESATCNIDCTMATCGDGTMNATAGEQCDDGNDDNTDGCSNSCLILGEDDIFLGGGCIADCSTGSGSGGGLVLLIAVALLWTLRRRRAVATTAVVALIAVSTLGEARAQTEDQRNFSAERFALASDQSGILDVESGAVIGHLNWDVGFWLGLANDPLAIYGQMNDDRERINPFLTQRIGGDLVFALGFLKRFQLGVQVPLIVNQDFEFMDDNLAPASSAGLGDIRLYPKVQLLRGSVDLALIPVVTLPTAGGDSYFGEVSVTFAPMLAASKQFGAVKVGSNLGYRARTNVPATLNLAPIDEVFLKFGAGYQINPDSARPIDVALSLSLATAAADIFGDFNRTAAESVLGGNFRVTKDWNVFAGVGVGLNPGFATPDWRVLAGLRFARRAELPLCERVPDHPDCLCINQPFHASCPENCDARPDDPRCPDKVECPDNPPNKDHDCDGVDAPPWLLVGLPPDGPAFETPEDKTAGTPPWVRISKDGPPPSIHEPPDGAFPPAIDKLDYCPAQPGTDKHHGCPEPSVVIPACKAGGVDIQVGPAVGFLAGKPTVNLPSRVALEALAAELKAKPKLQVSVEVGNDSANGELAGQRAGEIVTFLLGQGVDANNLVAVGHGAADASAADDPANYPVKFRMPCPGLPPEGPCKTLNVDKKIGIQFQVNSATLKPASQQMLKRDVLWVLKAHPTVKVRVEGHTSSEGKRSYNMKLSQRRADSVVKYLTDEGVDASRLRAVGYGPRYLLVKPERSKADREKNRRIEFLLTGGGSCPCETFKVKKVFFEYNSPVIKPQSFPDLDKLVRNLTERPNVYLSIEGHTSTEGRASYNKRLSARRAAAVRKYLIKGGIAAKRLKSRGWGKEKPLIQNDDTDEKKETNRRVEFLITRGADNCLPR